jgi:hypothetical protein
MIPPVPTARLLAVIPLIAYFASCNRTQQGVVCAPLTAVTLVRISQNGSGQPQQSVVDNRYQVQALVDFANGRRQGFSPRHSLPPATTSAAFYNGSQRLIIFGAGPNFFSMSCPGYAGVEEANRVQIAEFERLLSEQP